MDDARQEGNFVTMTRVLFVCLGNICRSPLAEAMFRHKLKVLKLQETITCDSCGTGDYHIGSQPDRRTIDVALKHNVPINHACRQLAKTDIEMFDFILAMDKSNEQNILRLATPEQKNKVHLMRSFSSRPEHLDVPDPYFGGPKDFQKVYDILDNSLDGFIQHLKKKGIA